jgi:hypothetical protein
VKETNVSKQTGALKFALTAATTTAVGGVLKELNPFGVDVIITRVVLDIPTPSSGAATIDAGIDDGGDVSSDVLLDGLSMATAGVFDNVKNGGTNGKAAVKWPADQYLVATASATTAGLVGNAHLEIIYP